MIKLKKKFDEFDKQYNKINIFNTQSRLERQMRLNKKIESTKKKIKYIAAISIMNFDLTVYDDGYVAFNEMLFKAIRRMYFANLFKDGHDEIQEEILNVEEEKNLKIIRKVVKLNMLSYYYF